MPGVNKVILIGNLGKDPELKYLPAGSAVANFTIATSEKFNDKSGQSQTRTEWHNIDVFAKLAELCNQYLKKGRTAYVEGRIQTRSWDDKDGTKRYKTEIVAQTVQFLGGAPGGRTEDGHAPAMEEQAVPAAAESIPEDDLPF